MVRVLLRKVIDAETLVTGFKGLGYVGYLTVNYMIEELGAELLGVIDTIYTPQYVTVRDGVVYSPYSIYGYRDILILHFEEMSMDEEANYVLKRVVEWSKSINVRRFVLVGGLDKSLRKPGDEPVKLIANRPWLSRYGPVTPMLREPIRVVGPLAMMLHYATLYEIPAVAVLAFADVAAEDVRAAANAIDKLNELLGLNISSRRLIEMAASAEAGEERRLVQEERRGEGIYA